MDIKDIQNLIKFVSKAEVSEVKYKTKDFEITIKTPLGGNENVSYIAQPQMMSAPAPAAQSAPSSTPFAESNSTENGADESKLLTIKSPMIGTFYRRPAPDKDLFINVGDKVKSWNSSLCNRSNETIQPNRV